MAFVRKRWSAVAVTVVAAVLLVTGGCASMNKDGQAEGRAEDNRNQPLYYDFGDVLVPSELEVDREASFVFQTPAMTAGVLALEGRVTMPSLIQFFEANMRKDNWRPVSSFKSVRTIMLYQKENRWCVINISEGGFATQVEIWVAPTTHESGGMGSNTFGSGGDAFDSGSETRSGGISEGSLLK